MNAADVVVAGHICLDIVPDLTAHTQTLDQLFVPGSTLPAGPAVLSTGGAVANTGAALHRLGASVLLMGKIGDDDLGEMLRAVVRKVGPELDRGLIVAPGEHTSYSLVIDPANCDRMFVHHAGANDSLGPDDLNYGAIAGARIFHFGYPTIMRRMYENGGAELEAIFRRVKALGVTTSLDMARPGVNSAAARADWDAILARCLPHVDLFLPSHDEMNFLLRSTDPHERMADYLLSLGARVVMLKLGSNGLFMRTKPNVAGLPLSWSDRTLHVPAFPAKVVGTTGAGDSAIAGLLMGILQGQPPDEALTSAAATAAYSVEGRDHTGNIPAWSAVQQRIAMRCRVAS